MYGPNILGKVEYILEIYNKKMIAFVTVNFNNSSFTKKFVESVENLLGFNNDKFSIVIVDNKSNVSDYKDLEFFCKGKTHIKLIKSETNRGYFGGLNLGLSYIEDVNILKGVIIGNNDLTFDSGFIDNYINKEYFSRTMVVAPNIITKDGVRQNPHVVTKVSKLHKIKSKIYFINYYISRFIKKLKFSKNKTVSKPEYNNPIVIKRGIGACYILTPMFFKYYDRLDDSVFMWGEEVLLSHQVEQADGLTVYDPSLKIIHYESATVSHMPSKVKYNMIKKSYKIYRKYL